MGKRVSTDPETAKAVHCMRKEKKTFAQIGSHFGHTGSWAKYVCKAFDATTGGAVNKRTPGRPKKLSLDQEESIRMLAENMPEASSLQITNALQKRGVLDCSARTVNRYRQQQLGKPPSQPRTKRKPAVEAVARGSSLVDMLLDRHAQIAASARFPAASSRLSCLISPESSESVTLYGWFRSSCSWRVRIALAWKGIKYENIPVSLQKGQQHSQEFLAKNPLGQVPALCIDGFVLTQSVAILEYLEETRPNNPLLPKEPKSRAQVRRIVETIVSGIQPHQNLPGLDIPPGTPDEWKLAWSKEWAQMHIKKGFAALEQMLKESPGKYCVGDQT
ncbi:hypothetical protein RvY_16062-2 [Ramazzottius varieornatus]|uniref:maleylacetoacetate isomerase n=1 Tax=Ramazzottius varieornatus TaxID=947166 RepID=A0A1D1VY66_RAMVA|nr:hypothetical protein RvY_16062-2 [Ramazzottius varieornatus]